MKSFKQYKEELKGNQHKLDHDKDGKIEADDLAKLRSKKKMKEAAYTNPGLEKLAQKKKQEKQMQKEEVELDEANHRDFASAGLMHPSMAKNMRVGQEMDFYARGTGDKLHGKVIKNDGKTVEVKVTVNPYKEKDNSVHKFKIADKMAEETELDEATPNKQQVKQGIGIARDKRYAGGNVTGAVKAMDKVNKGLAQHPAVKKELQKQNEQIEFSMTVEEFEQLDELSKSTLASYAKSATVDARMKYATGKDFERHARTSRKPEYKAGAKEWEDKYKSIARKRQAGVHKAIDRLAKEEVELEEAMKPYVSSTAPKMGEKGSHDVMDKDGKVVKSYPYTSDGMKAAKMHLNKLREEVELTEDHFKIGDTVRCKESGMTGKVVKLDKPSGKDDEEYYTVKRSDGKTMKYAPNELTLKEATKDQETKFHKKLDKLVHDTFGKRKEEMKEDLDEKIDLAKAKMGDVIKDFQQSDAPQFAGKSKEKRKEMAIAAKLEADRAVKEDVAMLSFKQITKLHETAEVIEEAMIGFSEFQQKIADHQKAGNKIVDKQYKNDKAFYVVVDKEGIKRKYVFTQRGRSVENMGQTTNSEKPKSKPEEKRGRGRPKGSASGARVKGSSKSDDDEGLDDTRYSLNLPNRR